MFMRFVGVVSIALGMVGCAQSTPTASNTPPVAPKAAAITNSAVPVVAPTAATQAPATPATVPSAPSTPPAVTSSQPPASVQSLLAQATKAASSQNFQGAIQPLEQAFAMEPSNRSVLSLLAECTQFQGMTFLQKKNDAEASAMFLKSGEYFHKLLDSGVELNARESQLAPQVLYNEACVFALAKQSEKAISSLGAAFDLGWADLAHVEKDSDLDSLRELPEFKSLIEQVPAKLLIRAKDHAKKLIAESKPFDFNFSLPDTEGATVTLADYKGKVLIVDVWGTWCPPCRMEIPHFVELHKKYGEAGLEIVGLTYERVAPDKVNETIKKFVTDNGVDYPCLVGDEGTQKMIPEFTGFPTTLFVDRTGKVRLKVVGYHPLASLEGIVTTLLAEGAGAPAAN